MMMFSYDSYECDRVRFDDFITDDMRSSMGKERLGNLALLHIPTIASRQLMLT